MEQNKFVEKIKNIGFTILAIGFFVGSITLFILLLTKGPEYALRIYPYLATFNSYVLFFVVPILFIMSFIKRTRLIGIAGLLYASYAFGFSLWILGFIVTYMLWGILGILIGLIFKGVGVVPIAFLAAIINGEWTLVLNLTIATVVTFGVRWLAVYLAHRADRKDEEESLKIQN